MLKCFFNLMNGVIGKMTEHQKQQQDFFRVIFNDAFRFKKKKKKKRGNNSFIYAHLLLNLMMKFVRIRITAAASATSAEMIW